MSNRLREVRVVGRITQSQLGLRAGLHPSRISLIENGLVRPREDEKIRLARALRMRLTEIWDAEQKDGGDNCLSVG